MRNSIEAKTAAQDPGVQYGPVGGYIKELADALPRAFRDHAGLLALVLVYWMGGVVIGELTDRPRAATVTMYLPAILSTVPKMIILLLIVRAVGMIAIERPERPLSRLGWELRHSLASPQRIAQAAPVLLGLPLFGGAYTVVKMSLPFLFPFTWDVQLEELDRWLHGGVAPWRLLQPLIGEPVITFALNVAYRLWFSILLLVIVWQAFSQRDRRLRLQFFFTLAACWILLGTVGAALLSSAGPCFYGRVTGLPDPFAPQIAYLREVAELYPIMTLLVQERLWIHYAEGSLSAGAGISAMPSMHLALATLFALVCWRTNRWLGVVMSAYVLVILVASIHLTWHYAVDGYVGIAASVAIWWIVGRVLARREGRAATLS